MLGYIVVAFVTAIFTLCVVEYEMQCSSMGSLAETALGRRACALVGLHKNAAVESRNRIISGIESRMKQQRELDEQLQSMQAQLDELIQVKMAAAQQTYPQESEADTHRSEVNQLHESLPSISEVEEEHDKVEKPVVEPESSAAAPALEPQDSIIPDKETNLTINETEQAPSAFLSVPEDIADETDGPPSADPSDVPSSNPVVPTPPAPVSTPVEAAPATKPKPRMSARQLNKKQS